jgi:hypothetical protein
VGVGCAFPSYSHPPTKHRPSISPAGSSLEREAHVVVVSKKEKEYVILKVSFFFLEEDEEGTRNRAF